MFETGKQAQNKPHLIQLLFTKYYCLNALRKKLFRLSRHNNDGSVLQLQQSRTHGSISIFFKVYGVFP